MAHERVSAGIDKLSQALITGAPLLDYVQKGVEDVTKSSGWSAKDLGDMLLDFDEAKPTYGDSKAASTLSDASKKALVDAIVAEVLKRRAKK